MSPHFVTRLVMVAGLVSGAILGALAVAQATASAATSERCQEAGLFVSGRPGALSFTVDAPHGLRATVATWDEYEGRERVSQAAEVLVITWSNGQRTTTTDLPDMVRRGEASTSATVEGPVTGFTVTHGTTGLSPDSVRGRVCVTPLEAPAATTTTTTSVPSTTQPEPPVELLPPTVEEPTVEAPVAAPVTAAPSFTG